ncbi:uncharacterized protein [Argopecten irradians]|uniref:uncharacterized protein n=1 Tax=Argopecten irradians TaxID=31199 RepID=UPI00371CE48A
MSGHQGMNRTLTKIKSRYYWPSMTSDIETYVRHCDSCQRQNHLAKTPSVLHPIPVKDKAFAMLGMDLVGPLRLTERGNRYVIVLTDYLTKWPEVKAIPSKDANEIADFVIETVCRHGTPEVILTDNGREFCNMVNDTLCSKLGIEHRLTTPYHPQTNGLTERYNQTLCCAISKYVNDTQDDWDRYIQQIAFATRTCIQTSTKATHFFLTYGREAVLPIQLDIPVSVGINEQLTELDYQEIIDDRTTSFTELLRSRKDAKEQIGVAQKIQKTQYDKKHECAMLDVGDLVLFKNKKRINRKGDKMLNKWTGPFRITEHVGKGVFRLDGKKTKVNVKSLKKYFPAIPEQRTQESEQKKEATKKTSAKCVLRKPRKRVVPRHLKTVKTSKKLRTRRKHSVPTHQKVTVKKTTTRTSQRATSRTSKTDATCSKTTPQTISQFFKDLPTEDVSDIFVKCGAMNMPRPRNPGCMAYAARDSSTLSFYLNGRRRYEEDQEECGDLLIRWYSSQSFVHVQEPISTTMLSSAVMTAMFRDNIDIETILETLKEVPLASELHGPVTIPNKKITVGTVTLHPADVKTLLPQKWLNDQVIHAYLGLLSSDQTYILPSFLPVQWEMGNFTWLYPQIPLHTYEHVLVPVCHKHHWFLLVASMDSQEINVLDSLPNHDRAAKFVNHWRKFMEKRENGLQTWKMGERHSSVQEDGNSCGVFVLMNAVAVVRHKTPAIMRQCHVASYRRYALKQLLANATVSSARRCDLPFCFGKKKGKTMYECTNCGRWCHKRCLGMAETDPMVKCILCV